MVMNNTEERKYKILVQCNDNIFELCRVSRGKLR